MTISGSKIIDRAFEFLSYDEIQEIFEIYKNAWREIYAALEVKIDKKFKGINSIIKFIRVGTIHQEIHMTCGVVCPKCGLQWTIDQIFLCWCNKVCFTFEKIENKHQ